MIEHLYDLISSQTLFKQPFIAFSPQFAGTGTGTYTNVYVVRMRYDEAIRMKYKSLENNWPKLHQQIVI